MGNNMMMLLLLLYMTDRGKTENQMLHNVKNFIQDIEVDLDYTYEKIRAFKKIAPLISKEYNQPFVKSIMITETLAKLFEIKSSFNHNNNMLQVNPIPIEDGKERIIKIINTIQEEIPRSKAKNMGMVMDLIINMEEYKKMFQILNAFMQNKDNMNEPEKMIKLVSQLPRGKGGKGEKGNTSPKDMEQIFNIIKVLNSSEKKEKPEQKNEA